MTVRNDNVCIIWAVGTEGSCQWLDLDHGRSSKDDSVTEVVILYIGRLSHLASLAGTLLPLIPGFISHKHTVNREQTWPAGLGL